MGGMKEFGKLKTNHIATHTQFIGDMPRSASFLPLYNEVSIFSFRIGVGRIHYKTFKKMKSCGWTVSSRSLSMVRIEILQAETADSSPEDPSLVQEKCIVVSIL